MSMAFKVRDDIKNNPNLSEWLEKLREKAEEYTKFAVPELLQHDYERFYRDGNRLEWEQKYFNRRGRLASYALMVFIYRDKRFIGYLEDIIMTICDESTWVVPAHMPENSKNKKTIIDLFAAETGSALSEICYLLSDELSESVKQRVHDEVQERIIRVYMDDSAEFSWFNITNNWAAVCSSGCAITCLYEGNARQREKAIERTAKIMENFLSGFSEEGVCMEGYSYWTYGFGFFLSYADMIYEYSNGEINYFKNDKVRYIARFVNGGIIRDGVAVSFADACSTDGVNMGYAYYLSAKYPEISVSEHGRTAYDSDSCYRWLMLVRTFVWTAGFSAVAHHAGEKELLYYPDAGWYIKKAKKYIVCAKAGDNDEPHNHNDVGSFYIDDYSRSILYDLGSGEYVRDYFSDKRYDFFVCRSEGHNLPIINGQGQKAGKEYSGKILEADSNTLCIEAAAAYGIDELRSFVRRWDMTDNEIVLTDRFEGEIDSVCERFITKEAVTVTECGFVIGSVTFESGTSPKVSAVEYYAHKGELTTAYAVDFELEEKEFKLRIKFE